MKFHMCSREFQAKVINSYNIYFLTIYNRGQYS